MKQRRKQRDYLLDEVYDTIKVLDEQCDKDGYDRANNAYKKTVLNLLLSIDTSLDILRVFLCAFLGVFVGYFLRMVIQ